jgi:streptogramin lyase
LAAGTYTITANFTPTNSAAWSANSAQATLVVSGESVWIVDGGGGTSELAGNGYGITSSAYPGASAAVAIDNAGNVWSVGTGSSALAETSQVGSHASAIASGTGGLDGPAAVAIDGLGQVWVSNAANSSVSLFTNAGTAVSPTAGITDSSLATPAGIVVDLSGSVWVANTGNNSVTRFLGVAAPVAPLATAAAGGTTGTRP